VVHDTVNYIRMFYQCGLPLHRIYRNHFEIVALMLEATGDNGATKFSIMKYANINSKQLNRYLRSLIEIDFIEMKLSENEISYKITEKGLEFLRMYHALVGMLLGLHPINKRDIAYEIEQVALSKQQSLPQRGSAFVKKSL